MSTFDALITLANAPDHELRMSELAASVLLSPSGLTRLVARLERDGLVERRPAGDDGRSFRAQLTPAGLDALNAARPTHNAVIRELYLDQLSSEERRQVASAWASVLAE